MNHVSLIGRLGSDPNLQYFESGAVKAEVNIAVKGYKKDEINWISVVFWKQLAELVGEYFRKGSQIGIIGRIVTDQWEQDGVKRSKTYVIADSVDFLDKKEAELEKELVISAKK